MSAATYDAERVAVGVGAGGPGVRSTPMSLQRSQTSGGITPARISSANALQPRHNPNTDSSLAASSAPSTAYAASGIENA